MKTLPTFLTAASALMALVASGFVPAPASVSLFAAAAEAKQPRPGQTKAKSQKPRLRGKAQHSAASKRAQERKQSAREARGLTSKPKTDQVAARQAGPSPQRTLGGKATIAIMGAKPGFATSIAAPTTPPLPPAREGQSEARPERPPLL